MLSPFDVKEDNMFKIVCRIMLVINLCIILSGSNRIDYVNIRSEIYSSMDAGDTRQNKATQVPLNIEGLHTFIAYYKNSIIYQIVDDPSVFYRYDIKKNTEEVIGTIPNFYLSGMHSAIIDNQLYFYVSLSEPKENALFSIDLQKNKLNKVLSKDNYYPLIPLNKFDDKLIYLKDDYIESKNVITSELVLYNPLTKREKTLLINELDSNAQNKKSLLDFTCDDKKIYIVVQELIDNKIKNTIEVYNKYFKQIVSFDTSELDYILRGHIADFKVFNNYIFISNASHYCAIAKIIDNQIEVIYEGQEIGIVKNHTNLEQKYYVFFERDTNKYLILDSNKNELHQVEYIINSKYVNRCLLADSENILFILHDYTGELDQTIYRLSIDEFINQTIN